MKLEACAYSCQGLTVITSGPLVAITIGGPQKAALFSPGLL